MRSIRAGFLLVLVYGSLAGSLAWGHPGGTDEYGCHVNPDTGEYHCH